MGAQQMSSTDCATQHSWRELRSNLACMGSAFPCLMVAILLLLPRLHTTISVTYRISRRGPMIQQVLL